MGLQDDIAYVSILIASIGFGYVFRQVPRELTFVNIKFQSRKYVQFLVKVLKHDNDLIADGCPLWRDC